MARSAESRKESLKTPRRRKQRASPTEQKPALPEKKTLQESLQELRASLEHYMNILQEVERFCETDRDTGVTRLTQLSSECRQLRTRIGNVIERINEIDKKGDSKEVLQELKGVKSLLQEAMSPRGEHIIEILQAILNSEEQRITNWWISTEGKVAQIGAELRDLLREQYDAFNQIKEGDFSTVLQALEKAHGLLLKLPEQARNQTYWGHELSEHYNGLIRQITTAIDALTQSLRIPDTVQTEGVDKEYWKSVPRGTFDNLIQDVVRLIDDTTFKTKQSHALYALSDIKTLLFKLPREKQNMMRAVASM